MINLLKFDFFKLRKSRSTWIILLLVVLFTTLSVMITYTSLTGNIDDKMTNYAYEISGERDLLHLSDMTVVDWIQDAVSGGFFTIFIAIYTVLFVISDFSFGYIKNIYGSIYLKTNYFISKLLISSFFIMLTTITSYIITIVISKLYIGVSDYGSITKLLKYTLIQTLLLISFSSLIIALTIMVGKGLNAIIISMGYSLIFFELLYTSVNQLVKGLFKISDFNIAKYTIIGNMREITLEASGKQYGIAIVVSLLVIIISLIMGSIFFAKKDVANSHVN